MRQKLKILNLYAGIGGNRKLWGGDIEVTAVELDPKIAGVYKEQHPNDNVVVGDAHEFLLKNFEAFGFIWASRPCQKHTKMVKFTRHKKAQYVDGALFEEIIFLQHFFKGLWVVENVVPYYEPYLNPVKIGRHLFWSNFNIDPFLGPEQPKGFINTTTVAGSQQLKDWLGIQYEGNIYYGDNHCPSQVLRNCVHPETGLHIFNCAKGIFERKKTEQYTLTLHTGDNKL